MGYEHGHYHIPLNEPDATLSIRVRKSYDRCKVAGVIPPLHIYDVETHLVLPIGFKVDQSSVYNVVTSVIHRFGCKMPPRDGDLARVFVQFYRKLIVRVFEPISDEDVPGYKQFILDSKYPGSRRAALMRLWSGMQKYVKESIGSKSFLKDEIYDDLKNARSINSPADESKCIVAAVMHAVDKVTFKAKWFVKGTNPRDWSHRLQQKYGNHKVCGTDFSSMEAHHYGVYADLVYFWIMHMTRKLTRNRFLRDIIAAMVKGVNNIRFKHVIVKIAQRLMSGISWTSSGNAVLNFNLIAFLSAWESVPSRDIDEMVDWVIKDFVADFEGDDGIFIDYNIQDDVVCKLGLKLKIERADRWNNIGFCQIYCDPFTHTIIKDPIKVMRRFFTLPRRYKDYKLSKLLGLLRARAQSYLTLYDGCPVIAPMARMVMRCTRSLTAVQEQDVLPWMRADGPSRNLPIEHSTRVLMASMFNIPIETQLDWENAFDSHDCFWKEAKPIGLGVLPFTRGIHLVHSMNFVADDPVNWLSPPTQVDDSVRRIVENGLEGHIPAAALRNEALWNGQHRFEHDQYGPPPDEFHPM